VTITAVHTRTALIFGLGAIGIWLLAFLPGPAVVLIVIAVVLGAVRGCHTLLQATAVSDRWGTQDFGTINGVFTAPMTAVGALAPVSGPALAGLLGGYSAMVVVMAVMLTAAAFAAARS
jgi:MFS family permease